MNNVAKQKFLKKYQELFDFSLSQISELDNNSHGLSYKHNFTQNLLIGLLFIHFTDQKLLEDLWNTRQTDKNFYAEYFVPLSKSDTKYSTFFDVPSDNIVVSDFVFYKFIQFLKQCQFSCAENCSDAKITPRILEIIFESTMLNRSETGSFYTPQSVVSFMCKESLKRYLKNNSDESIYSIDDFIDNGNVLRLNDTDNIFRLLDNVTIIDPACGSGAYLVGAAYELVFYKQLLSNKNEYDLKIDTIQKNIYGVDINEGAINIAKMRLFLYLTRSNTATVLPNFNIVCGDSISGSNPNPTTQLNLFDSFIEIPQINGVIEWRRDFPDVFNDDGFDIVLANPPYVSSGDIGENKQRIVAQYESIISGNADLYAYFYIRSLDILKKNGIQTIICSNSWMYTEYGSDLVKYLLNNGWLEIVYDSETEKQFATAEINTIISIVQKVQNDNDTKFVMLTNTFDNSVYDESQQYSKTIKRKDLLSGNKFGKYVNNSDIVSYIEKIYKDKLIKLGLVSDLRTGVNTSNDNFFYIDRETIDKYNIEDKFIFPAVKNIKKMNHICIDKTDYLFICNESYYNLVGTNALEYIKSFSNETNDWYVLKNIRPARLAINCFISTTARALYSEKPIYFGNVFNVFYSITVDIQKLCVMMNSSYLQLLANIYGQKSMGGGLLQFRASELSQTNIVRPDLMDNASVDMFYSDDWDIMAMSDARKNIDNLVFDALGLTNGERDGVYDDLFRLVGNRFKKRRNVLS